MKASLVALVVIAALGACGDSTSPAVGTPDATASNLGTMNTGDERTLTFSAASGGLQIPASLSTAQYLIVLSNDNVNSGGAVSNYSVRGDWLSLQATGPVADYFPPADHSFRANHPNLRGEEFEASLRAFERTSLPRPGGNTASSIAAADRLTPTGVHATVPSVGQSLSIKVLTPAGFNGENSTNCTTAGYTTTTGIVQAVSQYAIIVTDATAPSGGFTAADYQSIANEFDTLIYPTDVGYFGTPTDIDNNGHIIIYYTPAVNKLTPAGQAAITGYIGGFFFAGDLYPTTGANSCASSNHGEIFYLLAPDPSGVYGNQFATDFVRQVTRGTVAHEFQHMINSGNRYVSPNVVNFEATWLDEGLAHFAEDAVGRAEAGWGDTYTADYTAVNGLDQNMLSAFFLQNFARAKYYVERPDTAGPIASHSKAAANLATRGAAWSMLRYLADWFNTGGDPRTLTRKLAAGPDTGTVNIRTATGVPIDTILARWTLTLYTDHTGITGLNPVYNYKSYTFRDLISGTLIGDETQSTYLPIHAIGSGSSTIQASVPSSSASYFLTSLTNGGARTIRITDASGNPSADPNGRVFIIRTQ